jgi:hypothetical protein
MNNYYIFWVYICSLRYPACKVHAPYCHLRPARLYNIFPHYLINGTIFEETLLNIKRVIWVSLQLLSEAFLILWRNERDMMKNVYWSSCKVAVILVRFWWKLAFLRQIFEKYSNTRFHGNRFSGSRVVACGQTAMTKLIVTFCNLTKAPKS